MLPVKVVPDGHRWLHDAAGRCLSTASVFLANVLPRPVPAILHFRPMTWPRRCASHLFRGDAATLLASSRPVWIFCVSLTAEPGCVSRGRLFAGLDGAAS